MKRNMLRVTEIIIPVFAFTLIFGFSTAFAATIRVPSEQATIQAGIDAAVNGDTVLVANGTYTGAGNQNIDFKGKAITVESENGAANCIVDCEDYTVRGFYFHTEETETSVLKGFTVKNSNLQNSGAIDCYYSSPTITDCIISGNVSAGIRFWPYATVTVNACKIIGNGGTGIYCDGTLSLTNCKITDNGGNGVMVFSTSRIENCLITGNGHGYAWGGGGIIAYLSSSLTIINCTISGNTAEYSSGGVYLERGVVKNSIIWGNTPDNSEGIHSAVAVKYSDIAGYSGGGDGNIDQDPLFVGSGNYKLSENSPCIDTGTSSGAPDTDIDGTSRPKGSGYDMGAYEYFYSCPQCTGDPVELQDVMFDSDTNCECSAATSITLKPGVTVEQGANVTFKIK